jgi:hypothetical protein
LPRTFSHGPKGWSKNLDALTVSGDQTVLGTVGARQLG